MFITIVISIAIITCLINLFLANSPSVKKFFRISLGLILGAAFFLFLTNSGNLESVTDFVINNLQN